MYRVLFWLLALPLFVVVVLFAVMNPAPVELSVWPALEDKVLFPLYGVGLVGLLVGFVVGAIAAWIQHGRGRARMRALVRQAGQDRDEIVALKLQLERASGAKPATALPAPAKANAA